MNQKVYCFSLFSFLVAVFMLLPASAHAMIFIRTCQELQAMNNNLGETYILVNDIDCSATNPADPKNATSPWNNGGQGFIPVGSPANPPGAFNGNLDGQGYKIDKLFANGDVSMGTTGLFGVIVGGSVKNVSLNNVSIHAYGCAGGLVGNIYSDAQQPTVIENVHVTGQIVAHQCAGGIVGSADSAVISKSSANAYVESFGSYGAGGLAGRLIGVVQESFAAGQVYGLGGPVGGLIGVVNTNQSSISNSYSTASITLRGISGFQDYMGGLVGEANSITGITNSFATGNVSIGTASPLVQMGGIVGNNVASPVLASAWDTQTTGQTHSAGSSDASGFTTAQFIQLAPFFNWDYFNTWIVNGQGYPQLRWQLEPTASLWKTFNQLSRIPELLAASLNAIDIARRATVNWPDFEVPNNMGVNWIDAMVLSRPAYWDDQPVPAVNVNWEDFAVLSKAAINWNEMNIISRLGINWNAVNPLVRAGINWGSWTAMSRTGINWFDVSVFTRSRINWSTLSIPSKVGTNWVDLNVGTRTGINWTSVAILTNVGLNWNNIGVLNDSVNWTGVNVLSKKPIPWGSVSNLSHQNTAWDNGALLASVNMTAEDLQAIRTIGANTNGYIPSPYASWKTLHFMPHQLGNVTISGDAADPDIDGIINLHEYAFNLDPWVRNDSAYEYYLLNNRFTIKYRKNKNATDLTFRIAARTLITDSWSYADFSQTSIDIANDTQMVTAVDTKLRQSGYYQLEIALQGSAAIPRSVISAPPAPFYSLSVTTFGPGTVTSLSGAINCGALCYAQKLSGVTETLTAQPNPGYQFVGWNNGACVGTNPTCVVPYTARRQVEATFTKKVKKLFGIPLPENLAY